MEGGFFARVGARALEIDSVLCVGLDPHKATTAAEAEQMSIALIDATVHVACCFKPNSAFFEAFGGDGLHALKKVIAHGQSKGAPMLLDNKRGDVGSTADKYAVASFDALGADAVTLSPYLGYDTIKPFVGVGKFPGKGCFILCATSNSSAKEVQSDHLRCSVAKLCGEGGDWDAQTDPASKPLGLVVGATDLDALRKCREVNTSSWILAPGVGAQGASAAQVLGAGAVPGAQTLAESKIIVPVSRGIANTADPKAEAEKLLAELRNGLTKKKQRTDGLAIHQTAFLASAVACGALKFDGPFTLKSGRQSPYFFNAGKICGGSATHQLFESYAEMLISHHLEFDVVFGPAYKGIPLAAGLSAALSQRGVETSFAYNRKEAKDHGEGGTLVGADVKGKRVVLVDDVISAGTAVRESVALLKAAGATLVAIIVALDRQEITGAPGASSEPPISAVNSVATQLGVPVLAIVTLTDLLTFLDTTGTTKEHADGVRAYRAQYGAP